MSPAEVLGVRRNSFSKFDHQRTAAADSDRLFPMWAPASVVIVSLPFFECDIGRTFIDFHRQGHFKSPIRLAEAVSDVRQQLFRWLRNSYLHYHGRPVFDDPEGALLACTGNLVAFHPPLHESSEDGLMHPLRS